MCSNIGFSQERKDRTDYLLSLADKKKVGEIKMNNKGQGELIGWGFLILLIIISVGAALWALPQYAVWQQGLEGQAELARLKEKVFEK